VSVSTFDIRALVHRLIDSHSRNEALRRQAEQAESKPRAVSRPVPLSRRMSSGIFSMADGPESSDDELQGDTNKRRITRPLPRRTRNNTIGSRNPFCLPVGPGAPVPKKPRLTDVPLPAPQEMYDQQVVVRRRHSLRASNSVVKMEELSDDGWL
jgi:hypothetical protein